MIPFSTVAEQALSDPSKIPVWPGDVFAVAAAYLERSGEYSLTVSTNRPIWDEDVKELSKLWENFLAAVSSRLRDKEQPLLTREEELQQCEKELSRKMPQRLMTAWRDAMKGLNVPENAHLLLSVADEAARGAGVSEPLDDFIIEAAFEILGRNGGRSLGWRLKPTFGSVLPKQHCAQVGLTLRSLSHNLAWIRPDGVDVLWHQSDIFLPELSMVDFILLPWPLKVSENAFSSNSRAAGSFGPYAELFDYKPTENKNFKTELTVALEKYKNISKSDIPAIAVFPELSLTESNFEDAFDVCEKLEIGLVAGVHVKNGSSSRNESRALPQLAAGTNRKLDSSLLESARVQSKHHRWCLDRNQILQYKLGGTLPSTKPLWENITIPRRVLHFHNLGKWMCFATVICEDLARQEPASDVIRAIGPNLLIALLLDGPQIAPRWGARYASIFADDPGSSVLTLTSRGMCRLSHPQDATVDRSSAIALWRDSIYGERELELHGEESVAGVLTVDCRTREEFTADGRGDRGAAHYPVFSGWREI